MPLEYMNHEARILAENVSDVVRQRVREIYSQREEILDADTTRFVPFMVAVCLANGGEIQIPDRDIDKLLGNETLEVVRDEGNRCTVVRVADYGPPITKQEMMEMLGRSKAPPEVLDDDENTEGQPS